MDLVDVLPAASGKRFEDGRASDVIEKAIPVDRIFEVVQRFRIDVHVARISFLGQENGLGDGDAELRGHGVIEKFVVGRPPERIVDDVCSLENGMLEVAAVILDLMGDAVHDDAVSREFTHPCSAKFHEFRSNAVFLAELIDANDKGRWKTVFTPAEKANLFHNVAPAGETETWHLRRYR